MNGYRGSLTWPLALVLSLLAHGLLWWSQGERPANDDGAAPRTANVTHLSFRSLKAQAPAPMPDLPVPPKPQPPKPLRSVEPKPILPVPLAKHSAVVEAPQVAPPPPAATAIAEAASEADEQTMERARRNYLGELLAYIEARKFYPRAARRRGLEGVVQVSFVLKGDGRISELQIAEGPAILQEATRRAIAQSQPLPPPPPGVAGPFRVSYGMAYKLD